jgi:phage replication-related protein YjqB (UPF0714/DUF867 family)
MSKDTYNSYSELKNHQELNKDYLVSMSDVDASVTIIAPHGGKIEPRTSKLAKMIAGRNYNYYCFEGIKRKHNGCLHITSHNFDEPNAVELVSRSNIVVAIHACTGNAGFVHIGGLDKELKNIIAKELDAKGIRVSKEHPGFQGSNPNNICNRGASGKGVQLEITRDLRDDLEKVQLISEAVKAALFHYLMGTHWFKETVSGSDIAEQ